jgi:hypothetical protein
MMQKGRAKIVLIGFLCIITISIRAQLLTNLQGYRNQTFVNSGYYLSFANYSVGWIHSERIKFLKRDVTGIIDFSFPYSHASYTRFVFRKGLQTNIWSNETFRLPVALIGSSDKIITDLFRIHNFVTDFFFVPGIYKKNYTLALDLDYKVTWFSHYREIKGPDPNFKKNAREVQTNGAAGIAAGLNYSRFTYLLRGGYQQHVQLEHYTYSFYVILQLGYNFNFKKRTMANTLSDSFRPDK